MKKLFFIALLLVLIVPFSVSARSTRTSASDVYVKGYYRSNGTYVQPHYRSAPDGVISNNYSCIDDGRCGTESGSVSTYTAPITSPTTPTCTANATWSGSNCICDTGYFTDEGLCILGQDLCVKKYGSMAFFDTVDTKCYSCPSGFTYQSSDHSCNSIATKPSSCGDGYGWSDYHKACIALARPYQEILDQVDLTKKFVTTRYRVNIRMSPSVNSKKIGTAEAKERYELLNELGGWVNIQYGDRVGWIRADLVTR